MCVKHGCDGSLFIKSFWDDFHKLRNNFNAMKLCIKAWRWQRNTSFEVLWGWLFVENQHLWISYIKCIVGSICCGWSSSCKNLPKPEVLSLFVTIESIFEVDKRTMDCSISDSFETNSSNSDGETPSLHFFQVSFWPWQMAVKSIGKENLHIRNNEFSF